MLDHIPRHLVHRRRSGAAQSLETGAVTGPTPAVVVHHSRSPVVQTPGTLVMVSGRAFITLGCVRQFEPHEPLLLVTGPIGARRVAGAVFEDRDQDTVALRMDGDWRSFDQRKSSRYICNLTASVVTQAGLWETAAKVINISQGGLAFTCLEAPPVPDVVVVLSGDEPIPLPCRVVSKRSDVNRSFVIGAKFMGLGHWNEDVSISEAHTAAFQLATGLTPMEAPAPAPEEEILGRRARR